MMCRSVPHIPQASTSTTTQSLSGVGSSMSRTSRTRAGSSSKMAALMAVAKASWAGANVLSSPSHLTSDNGAVLAEYVDLVYLKRHVSTRHHVSLCFLVRFDIKTLPFALPLPLLFPDAP